MGDKSIEAAELMHKLTSSGMFPALKLAMNRFAKDDTDRNWANVLRESPQELLNLIREGVGATLPLSDGYDAKDQPMWNSSTLADHLGVDHSEVEQRIKDLGIADECSSNQIIGLVN